MRLTDPGGSIARRSAIQFTPTAVLFLRTATSNTPLFPRNPFFPASGPANRSFNGLHPQSKFLAIYHPERDRWLLITASTVARIPTRREICVFSWDNQFERLDYHGITFPVEQ